MLVAVFWILRFLRVLQYLIVRGFQTGQYRRSWRLFRGLFLRRILERDRAMMLMQKSSLFRGSRRLA